MYWVSKPILSNLPAKEVSSVNSSKMSDKITSEGKMSNVATEIMTSYNRNAFAGN